MRYQISSAMVLAPIILTAIRRILWVPHSPDVIETASDASALYNADLGTSLVTEMTSLAGEWFGCPI